MLAARSISPVETSANNNPVVDENVPVKPPVIVATGFVPFIQYVAASYEKAASSLSIIVTANVSSDSGQAPCALIVLVTV